MSSKVTGEREGLSFHLPVKSRQILSDVYAGLTAYLHRQILATSARSFFGSLEVDGQAIQPSRQDEHDCCDSLPRHGRQTSAELAPCPMPANGSASTH